MSRWAVSFEGDICRPLNKGDINGVIKQNAVRGAARLEYSKDTAFNATYFFAGPTWQRWTTTLTPDGQADISETKTKIGEVVGLGHRWLWDSCSTYVEAAVRNTGSAGGVDFGGTTIEFTYGVSW